MSSLISKQPPRVVEHLPSHEPKSPANSTDHSTTPGKETLKVQHDQNGEAIYTDPSHWMSILQEIQFVRASLPSQNSGTSNGTTPVGGEPDFDLNLNLGPSDTFSIPDALTSLPAQPVCDMLLSKYFNSRYMVLGMFRRFSCVGCHTADSRYLRDRSLWEVP